MYEIVYTGTIEENVTLALDPNTRKYDKNKILNVSKYKKLYVGLEFELDEIVDAAIRVNLDVNEASRPVVLKGKVPRNDLDSCKFTGSYFVVSGILPVEKIYAVDDENQLQDITHEFINTN